MKFLFLFTFCFFPFYYIEMLIRKSESLIIIKPDIMERQLEYKLIQEIPNKLCYAPFTWNKVLAEEFYKEHKGKTFYKELVGSLVGRESIFILTTNPIINIRGKLITLIRNKYAIDATRNSIHASDSNYAFNREVNLLL